MVFSAEKMQKVRMIVLAKERDNIVRFLHQKGLVELTRSKLSLQDDLPSEELKILSDLLIKVNGAVALLKRPKALEVRKLQALPRDNLIDKINELSPDYMDSIFAASDRIRLLNEEIKAIENAQSVAMMFDGIDVDFSKLRSDVLSFKAFLVPKKFSERARRALEDRKLRAEAIDRQIDGQVLFFVAFKRGAKLDEAISGLPMREIDLGAAFLKGRPKDIIAFAGKRLTEDRKSVASLHEKIESTGAKHYSELLSYREMLELEVERASVPSEFKKTEKTTILEGWVAQKDYARLSEELTMFTKGRCMIEKIEADGPAPTLMNRPRFLKPFDYLVDFFSTPKSSEVDPTWVFIISFPIFYGLMVSDVGYGIVSFLLATWLTTFTDPEGLVYNTARVWQITAIAAAFFGIISDQYFGYSLGGIFAAVRLFDWTKDISLLLLVTVFFGVSQVIVGLLFGFVNSYREHRRRLAYGKLTSILTILFGIVAVGGLLFNAFPAQTAEISAILAVATLVLSGILSGREATELTNLITHPLSYTRIMGFGLASVIIAFLIDMAFTPTLSYGIPVFVVLVIVFITLHMLNMILAIFEGIVQGVRLNFVEFFSKFYEGGGEKFRPFSYKKRYIE